MVKKIGKIIVLILCCCFLKKATAQNWDSVGRGTGYPSFPFSIRSMFTDTTADLLYVGGNFANGGGINGKGIISWSGANWDTLERGLDNYPPALGTYGGDVQAMCRYKNQLYVGGGFIQAGTVNATCIARWDGTTWSGLPSYPNGIIADMMVYNDELYVCGIFDSIGSLPVNGLAKWNDTAWSDVHALPNYNASVASINYVFSLATFQGNLYVAGNFEGSAGLKEIVYWNGTQWQNLAGGIQGAFSEVSCMAVFQNELYVAGTFTIADGGNIGNYIQRWDGSNWKGVGGEVMGASGGNGQIWDMKVINNQLYVVGVFATAGGIPAEYIASWDGTDWCGYGSDFSNPLIVIEEYNNEIYVGGAVSVDGDTVNMIAKWIGGTFVDTCGHLNVGINEFEINQSLNIYPNPATNQVTLELDLIETKNVAIEIKNVLGQTTKIVSNSFTKGTNKIEVDVSNFPSGVYFIQLMNGEKMSSAKFVKQ